MSGTPVPRLAGAVHPSALVTYAHRSGPAAGCCDDFAQEHRGVRALVDAGAGAVELHGHTHVRAPLAIWAGATDRLDDERWYQEFEGADDPVAVAHAIREGLGLLRRHFREPPVALLCPGQRWTRTVLDEAFTQGLEAVCGEDVALRDEAGFHWLGLPSTGLDCADGALLGATPVVGLCHDRDVALHGPAWLASALDAWLAVGARRLVDVRELVAALSLRLSLRNRDGEWWLETTGRRPVSLPRARDVVLRFPSDPPPATLITQSRIGPLALPVQRLEQGLCRVVVPGEAELCDSALNRLGAERRFCPVRDLRGEGQARGRRR